MKTIDLAGQSLLSGLIFGCPLSDVKSNCPFKLLRMLSVERRLEIIENYSDSEKEKIIFLHKQCLSKNDIYSKIKCSKNVYVNLEPIHCVLK